MRPLVFYVSGHGFGHASRVIEVINALHARQPALPVIVRTAAARWLFDLTIRHRVEFHAIACDTGVVQIDSLHLDEAASIRQAAAFHAELDRRAEAEAGFLRAAGAGLVVGDIPPLAFAAAARAGIPSMALGNFTWDWIYEGYPEHVADWPDLLPAIRAAYRQADVALRLPLWGGFEAFRTVHDLPFVARHATQAPEAVRSALGIPARQPAVLLSFGGYGLGGFAPAGIDEARARGYTIVTTDQVGARVVEGAGASSVITLSERVIYERGYRYEDLVAAVDIVATKPGYGIIAECLANGTGMLYTSRGRFREYDVLVGGIHRHLRHAFISHGDLYGGRWSPHLDSILTQPDPPNRPATNGADVAAEILRAAMSGLSDED